MKIETKEQLKASKKISRGLADKIRGSKATEAEIAEYNIREESERAFIRTLPEVSQFAGKTCDELGLMP